MISGQRLDAGAPEPATYGKAHTQDHKQHVLVESGLWFLRDDWREVPRPGGRGAAPASIPCPRPR